MALSWNVIKDRALNFSKEWAGTSNEEADANHFWTQDFNFHAVQLLIFTTR